MTKAIHDLTDSLPWVDGVKSKCRQYVGHYGDTYVLPVRCIIDTLRIKGICYGRFNYISSKGGKNSILTTTYSDDEPQAYEKFMRRLAASSYCTDIREDHVKMSEAVFGEKTAKLYERLGIPKIYGVCLMENRGKIRCLSSTYLCEKIITYPQQHVLMSGKEAIIQVFKEHLKKMPTEWLTKRHIPEIYLG